MQYNDDTYYIPFLLFPEDWMADTHMGRPNSSRSIAELCVTPSLSINIFLNVVTFTSISSAEYLNKTNGGGIKSLHHVNILFPKW